MTDVETLSYEEARAAREDVVRRLEDGGTTLDEALALWERGDALHRRCDALLAAAEARVAETRPAGDERDV